MKTTIRTLAILTGSLIGSIAYAQEPSFKWVKSLGDSDTDIGMAITPGS